MRPRDEFLIAMFNDDPQLVEMFRQAELKRSERRKDIAITVAAWIAMFAVATVMWIGIIKMRIAAIERLSDD